MQTHVVKVAAFGDFLETEAKVAFLGDIREWAAQNPALAGGLAMAPIGLAVGMRTTPEEEPEKRWTRGALGALLAGTGGAIAGKALLPRFLGGPASSTPAPSGTAAAERVVSSPIRAAAAEPPSVTARTATPQAVEGRLVGSEQQLRQQAVQQADQALRQAAAAREKAALIRDQVRVQERTRQLLSPQTTVPIPGSPRGFITLTPGPGVRQVAGPTGMPVPGPDAQRVAGIGGPMKVPGTPGGLKYASLREATVALSAALIFKRAAAEQMFGGQTGPAADQTAENGVKKTTEEAKPSLVPWPGASGVKVKPEDVS